MTKNETKRTTMVDGKAVTAIAEGGSLNKKPKVAMEEHRVGLKEGGSDLEMGGSGDEVIGIGHGGATADVDAEATSLNNKPKMAMEEHRVCLREGGSDLEKEKGGGEDEVNGHGGGSVQVETEATGGRTGEVKGLNGGNGGNEKAYEDTELDVEDMKLMFTKRTSNRIQQCIDYFEENGHLNITYEEKREKYKGFYNWICKQRRVYNNHVLQKYVRKTNNVLKTDTKHLLVCLHKLGVQWMTDSSPDYVKPYDPNLIIKGIKDELASDIVEFEFKDHSKVTYPGAKIVGPSFYPNLKKLLNYQDEHGNFDRPKVGDNTEIQSIIEHFRMTCNQFLKKDFDNRRYYVYRNQFEILNSIGFVKGDWVYDPSLETVKRIIGGLSTPDIKEVGQDFFKQSVELLEYNEIHGHMNVPQRDETIEPDERLRKLGSTVSYFRNVKKQYEDKSSTKYKSSRTEKQIKYLTSIGFEFTLMEKNFENKEFRLDEFKQDKDEVEKVFKGVICDEPVSRKENFNAEVAKKIAEEYICNWLTKAGLTTEELDVVKRKLFTLSLNFQEIRDYVNNHFSQNDKVQEEEKNLRAFTILNMLVVKKTIEEMANNKKYGYLETKDKRHCILMKIPFELKRELCRGALSRLKGKESDEIEDTMVTRSYYVYDILNGDSYAISKKTKKVMWVNKQFSSLGGKNGNYTDWQIAYTHTSNKSQAYASSYSPYRLSHILLDNEGKGILHLDETKNKSIQEVYFEKSKEEEICASDKCDVDHLFGRDEEYLNSILFTAPVGHSLNGQLTGIRQRAGDWCFLLTSKKHNEHHCSNNKRKRGED